MCSSIGGQKGQFCSYTGNRQQEKISLARRRIEKKGENFSLSLIKQAIALSAAKGKKRVAPEAKKDLKKKVHEYRM